MSGDSDVWDLILLVFLKTFTKRNQLAKPQKCTSQPAVVKEFAWPSNTGEVFTFKKFIPMSSKLL